MFSWFKKKKHESDELKIVSAKLEYLKSEISRWHHDQTRVLHALDELKTNVDYNVRIVMADIQERYIRSLEDRITELMQQNCSLKHQMQEDYKTILGAICEPA